jgi:hypothetical protein
MIEVILKNNIRKETNKYKNKKENYYFIPELFRKKTNNNVKFSFNI